MLGLTISHFKILEKIGEGGMGIVYKAQDVRLDRPAALKFLPRGLASSHAERERFNHEAKAASALNHPNITTVYEIGEHDGQLFIAMELVEGKTLKKLANEETLPLHRILDIGIQLCEALAGAHEKGIVHRDIKGDNIMLTPTGQVKIMDFGLAKLKGASKLTLTGSVLGTLAYMSPEQAQGKEVDRRSDIFSLGVVLYELITGKLPFNGEHPAALIYTICNEEPEPLTRFRSGVPENLLRIFDKALAKELEERYQDIADLRVDLSRARKGLDLGPKETSEVAKRAIAVLYFENLSPDPDSDYFAAGMTEDIITDLSKIEGIRVASRNAVLAYKSVPLDIPQLGKKLKVDAILVGSVRKAGSRLRITAQLIGTKEGFHLWAERYDRESTEVFELQEEIAKNITSALKIKLSPKDEKQLAQRYKGNLQAYDYYLKGRDHYYKYTKSDMVAAIQMFKKALELDPNYALAYAGLGDCYFQMFDKGFDSDKSWLKKSEEACLQALGINPFCAEAYKALAGACYRQGRHNSVKRFLEKALEINPNYAPARANLGIELLFRGDLQEAEKQLLLVREQDPSIPFSLFFLVGIHLRLNNFAKAESLAKELLETGESIVFISAGHQALSDVYLYQRQFDKALEHIQRSLELDPTEPYGIVSLAAISAGRGKREEALERIKEPPVDTLLRYDTILKVIETYALLNERDKAYQWMRKGIDENQLMWYHCEHNPLLEEIRKEPEFQKLLAEAKEKILNSE